MTYVMSDIHGEADRFYRMLEQIAFSDSDHLYILGDVIDRGREGVDLLLDIMGRPNITMLLGNHEQMMLDTFAPDCYPDARQLWAQNGGNITRRELLYHRTSEDRHKILQFCRSLPTECFVSINGVSYHLVHGYPAANDLDRIWKRVSPDDSFSGYIHIVGHTPTCFLTGRQTEPYSIYHGTGFIDIDCGCGNLSNPFRRLACLRLEDQKNFYI